MKDTITFDLKEGGEACIPISAIKMVVTEDGVTQVCLHTGEKFKTDSSVEEMRDTIERIRNPPRPVLYRRSSGCA